MSQLKCGSCAATIAVGSRFCEECGTPLAPSPKHAIPPAATASTPRAGRPTDATVAGLPLELWLVIAMFALPGAWLTVNVLGELPDSLSLIGAEFFGWRIGLALTLIVVMVGLMGAGMLAIAWKLYRVDRVGRGLSYVVAGTIMIGVITSGNTTSADVAALLGSIAGASILAASPRVRETFAGPSAIHRDVPTSVIVSRVSVGLFSALAVVLALTYFLLATVDASYALVGVVALLVVALASKSSARLMQADRQARVQLSIGAGVLVVLALALGKASTGLTLPLGLIAAAIACLWLPNDARAFFGDPPLLKATSNP